MAATEPGSGDNPHFIPDWNANGVYGEPADIELEHQDDPVTARFRYPCMGMDGVVTYRTVDDTCAATDAPGAQFRTGEIRKVSIVDSRGVSARGPAAAAGGGRAPRQTALGGVLRRGQLRAVLVRRQHRGERLLGGLPAELVRGRIAGSSSVATFFGGARAVRNSAPHVAMTPRTSGSWNVARVDATTRSQARTSSKPPP